jgi:hypothetical protein
VGSRLRAKCWWGAPGICAAIASWSARGSSESRAPQAIRRADVVGEVAQPVALCWLRGVAMTALVERERADPLRQRRQGL